MELEQGMTVEQCLIKLGVSREGVLAVQQGGRVLEMTVRKLRKKLRGGT